MKILVTGAAGFIGFHIAKKLCERGDDVIGIDNLNDYYDVSLKKARLAQLEPYSNFKFLRLNIADREAIENLFKNENFGRVLHMAAQAGVRYSLENPHAYINSNIVGFMNILEGCRKQWGKDQSQHLVFASSSSVYGLNTKMPFSVHDNVDHPISLYAATKKANELMAHTYSYLYGMPTTGLRFFTVYGPWGRPDMALFKFTKAIMAGEPIDVYNEGRMRRDFTYIDDIVEGVIRIADRIPSPSGGEACPEQGRRGQGEGVRTTNDPSTQLRAGERRAMTPAPYRLYNIGNNNPVELLDFIKAIEEVLGKEAKKNFLPLQPGDVPATYADIDDLRNDVGFSPSTPINIGIKKFVEWYRSYIKRQS